MQQIITDTAKIIMALFILGMCIAIIPCAPVSIVAWLIILKVLGL